MQIIFQRRKVTDVTPARDEGKKTNRRPVDASTCSCDPRACLIYNWEGLCFGTMELWLDELDGTNEQQGGCDG